MAMTIAKMKKKQSTLHEAIVPPSIIDQTKAFTAPRGRMEMGGLLFGHVDEQGRNVCVAGIFPKQTQSTPHYCEFDGKWLAIGAAAALRANEAYPDEKSPDIRVIGWIHTHPGLTVFLSGTDVSTFRRNMRFCPDGRFIAVVVDPLTDESGVFNTPEETRKYSIPKGEISLTENMERRYVRFLEELESVRGRIGREELPFIISGDLREKHVSAGNSDDTLDSNMDSIHQMKRRLNLLEDQIGNLVSGEKRDFETMISKMGAQQLVLEKRAREDIEEMQIGVLEAEESISNLRKETLQEMEKLRKLRSRDYEEIRITGLSIRNQSPRIEELERTSKRLSETSDNILRGISKTENLKEHLEIHNRAIRQLRTVVNELPSRLSANKQSHKRRESIQWHEFWDDLNDPETTPDGILDSHIGLIGTNQKLALSLIKAKKGVKAPKADFSKRVRDFSESFTESVDTRMMILAANIVSASRKIRPLSERLILAFNQKAKGALETTTNLAKEASEGLGRIYLKYRKGDL